MSTRRTQNIDEELLRLYFDTEKNQSGKYKVRLFIEEESVWPLEIVTNENNNRLRYLAQIKGTGLRHVSIILKRSDDRSEVSVAVKALNGTIVKYIMREKEYFNFESPQISLREIPLLNIAKEIEPLLVFYQDEAGEFKLDKIADALQQTFQKKQKMSGENDPKSVSSKSLNLLASTRNAES